MSRANSGLSNHVKDTCRSRADRSTLIKAQLSALNVARVASILIQYGANINAVTNSKETPLHAASEYGQPLVAEFLLENGAAIDLKEEWGNTSLHYASKHGRLEIVTMLVENGANINARARKRLFFGGKTPLSYAMDSGHENIIEYLKSKGAKE